MATTTNIDNYQQHLRDLLIHETRPQIDMKKRDKLLAEIERIKQEHKE